MALLEYVDPEEVDEYTRNLLIRDAEYYEQPSLFARALANNPDVFALRSEYHRNLVIEGDLSERLGELVYLTVSVTNDCPYCIASHREQLVERVGIPQEEAESLAMGDFTEFSERERAVIEFATQIALDPKAVDEADLTALREVGFGDADAVHLLTIAAAAIAANTIADALDVHPEDRKQPFK